MADGQGRERVEPDFPNGPLRQELEQLAHRSPKTVVRAVTLQLRKGVPPDLLAWIARTAPPTGTSDFVYSTESKVMAPESDERHPSPELGQARNMVHLCGMWNKCVLCPLFDILGSSVSFRGFYRMYLRNLLPRTSLSIAENFHF